MEMIYGKLNRDTILAEYKGLSTKTAVVNVDNSNYTISVDVLGGISGNSSLTNALLYTQQFLTDSQINQVYQNLNLKDYLNKNIILINKEHQVINGDLQINGDLRTRNNYVSVNYNDIPLGDGETAGLLVRNWKKDTNARVYVTSNGELRYSNEIIDQPILTRTPMTQNKFTYFNGQALSTRDIKPNDVNTEDYTPENPIDLVTKQYVDKSMRQNMNYAIVETNEQFNRLNA